MVGGEEANNVEVRERRSRRRRHAEERRRLLAEANANLDNAADDDGIMLGIYESIQDELRHKCKLLQREKQKVCICSHCSFLFAMQTYFNKPNIYVNIWRLTYLL